MIHGYRIESQQRGSPHVHLFTCMDPLYIYPMFWEILLRGQRDVAAEHTEMFLSCTVKSLLNLNIRMMLTRNVIKIYHL